MRKLVILKGLIDFIWILTCMPLVLLIVFASVYMFIEPSILNIFFKINEIDITNSTLSHKIVVLLLFIVILICIYCFYLFRKTLRYFQQLKPFDLFVINTYNKIGRLLVFSGIGATVLFIAFNLIFESKLKFNLGLGPYLSIVCLGLFFMVLSEVFKVAKVAKEENNLTI